jgi:hypothetical protein
MKVDITATLERNNGCNYGKTSKYFCIKGIRSQTEFVFIAIKSLLQGRCGSIVC